VPYLVVNLAGRQASKQVMVYLVEYHRTPLESGHYVRHPINGQIAKVTHIVNSTGRIYVGDHVTYEDDVVEVIRIPFFSKLTNWDKMVQIKRTSGK
jgi:hypothetical protein